MNRFTKFGANPSTGLSGEMMEYSNNFIYLIYLFSETRLQVRPLDGFWCVMAQKTRSDARVIRLGVRKIRLTFNPCLSQTS